MTAVASLVARPVLPARGFLVALAQRYRLWRQRRRWIAEMADATALGHLDDILNDAAISRADLRFLIEAPVDAGRQIDAMAHTGGVDLAVLPPDTRREAEWVCARCVCRGPCKHWLRTGEWQDGDDTRCPNAALFRQ
jgi:uncharacterized protein YjiS (DUF1127 family)